MTRLQRLSLSSLLSSPLSVGRSMIRNTKMQKLKTVEKKEKEKGKKGLEREDAGANIDMIRAGKNRTDDIIISERS